MKKRTLGNSGHVVAPFAFGGNVFGWTVDEPTSFRLLDAFVAAGFDFIDIADFYSKWVPGNQGGESESILGQRHQRDATYRPHRVGETRIARFRNRAVEPSECIGLTRRRGRLFPASEAREPMREE
jgi:aryl-alcohol dehydrogenase-like predicted oxidoreductase